MASERDEELNKRREIRRKHHQQRRKEENRQRFRYLVAAAVLIIVAIALIVMIGQKPASEEQSEVSEANPTDSRDLPDNVTQAPTEAQGSWEKPPQTIHIAAAGDLNVTDRVVWAGQSESTFDYSRAFMDVAPILSEADLSVLNFEGNLIGPPYGSASTSAPVEMIHALKNAGVDLLQVANSCSVNNGMLGLNATLDSIRAAGIEPVGAFSSNEQFRRSGGYTMCTVNGITVAVVAFTKGVGGLGMPSGSENCVNMLYTDYYENYHSVDTEGITSILKNVASENPDITIALLHWGSEYNDSISDSQEKILNLMKKNGVDVILGTHPHLVHKIDFDETTGFLCAYSLGDFFGDGQRGGTNYSIILDLEITKDYDTNTTRVTDYTVTPIYILSESETPESHRQVVRLENATEAYELNFVDKVTSSAYESMKTALERINARIRGE